MPSRSSHHVSVAPVHSLVLLRVISVRSDVQDSLQAERYAQQIPARGPHGHRKGQTKVVYPKDLCYHSLVDEAVKKLDHEMKSKTDPELLRKARHEQRGVSYCLLMGLYADIVTELDYGGGTR